MQTHTTTAPRWADLILDGGFDRLNATEKRDIICAVCSRGATNKQMEA